VDSAALIASLDPDRGANAALSQGAAPLQNAGGADRAPSRFFSKSCSLFPYALACKLREVPLNPILLPVCLREFRLSFPVRC
jgi:hypothetical protein